MTPCPYVEADESHTAGADRSSTATHDLLPVEHNVAVLCPHLRVP